MLLLGGPTASGKSELAVELAERFDAEIVGADSRQIYRGMPIGTAAPSEAMLARVPHHLIAFLDPQERYSAARFVRDALAAIRAIHARGRRAIVAGGTGFYLRALAGDVELGGAEDSGLRERLAREASLHPPDVLHAWLVSLAPERAAALSPGDGYRVMRALEIALVDRDAAALEPPRDGAGSADVVPSLRSTGHPFQKFVLTIDDAELEARIERRVDVMLAAGLLDEAERVGANAIAADAVGYPQALAYLAGWSTRAELRAALVRATRRYAKRQRTWFRSERAIELVPVASARETFAERAGAALGW